MRSPGCAGCRIGAPWHIMKIYAASGITDFAICLGYRGDMIERTSGGVKAGETIAYEVNGRAGTGIS